MHMLAAFAVFLPLLTLTAAQNATSATNGSAVTAASNYGLNPNSVDLGTRQYWCNQQTAQCPLICGDTTPGNDTSTIQNSCDPNSLTYQCICSNNQSPNATQYTQTIPFFECQESGTQCIANCVSGDTQCQNNCRVSRPCGASDPKVENHSTTTSAAPTASATSSGGLINGSSAAPVVWGPGLGALALVGIVTLGLAVVL